MKKAVDKKVEEVSSTHIVFFKMNVLLYQGTITPAEVEKSELRTTLNCTKCRCAFMQFHRPLSRTRKRTHAHATRERESEREGERRRETERENCTGRNECSGCSAISSNSSYCWRILATTAAKVHFHLPIFFCPHPLSLLHGTKVQYVSA